MTDPTKLAPGSPGAVHAGCQCSTLTRRPSTLCRLHRRAADRLIAIEWARDLLERDDWLILDLETTSLRGRIVQMGLLSPRGHVLLDWLLDPRAPIDAGAQAIHGIGAEDVAPCGWFADTLSLLLPLTATEEIVIYNAAFDRGILYQEMRRAVGDAQADGFLACRRWRCAMEPYSAFVGEVNERYGGYKWQKLPGGDHTAIGDCRAVLKIIHLMAEASE